MIEISASNAVAQNAALKVAKALDLFEGHEPGELIRCIDNVEKNGAVIAIRCTFWVNGNPTDKLDIDIHLSGGGYHEYLPWLAIVRYPLSGGVERWDFDNGGQPYRVK